MPAIIRLETGTREMEIFSEFITQAGSRNWPDPADILEPSEIMDLDEKEYIYCIEQCWAVGNNEADDFNPQATEHLPLGHTRPVVGVPGLEDGAPGVGLRTRPRTYTRDQHDRVEKDIDRILKLRKQKPHDPDTCQECGRDLEKTELGLRCPECE